MKKVILLFIFTLSFCAASFALTNQTQDTFTITTYYPAPHGVYGTMRLYPGGTPSAGVEEGVMYYDQNLHMMRYLNNTTWVNVTAGGGGGGGYWTQQSGTGNIYNTNSSGNVGIGTTTPAQKLDVAGNIKTSGNIIVGPATTAVNGSIRFNGSGFEGYYNGTWNPLGGGGGGNYTASGVKAGGGSYTVQCAKVDLPGFPTPQCSCGDTVIACSASTPPAKCVGGGPTCETGWHIHVLSNTGNINTCTQWSYTFECIKD